ncbi:MAG: hypothetical protein K1X95_13730 [Acidimicrobiia bacterium]|nr:hypothetical protein [Acidimicrobiia bacterium]
MTPTYTATTGDVAGLGAMMLVIWGVSLLIMVVLGLVTANIMGKKGYSKGLGFVLGFFGGIVGIIVAVVLNDKTPPRSPAYVQGSMARGQVAATQYPQEPFSPTDYYSPRQ